MRRLIVLILVLTVAVATTMAQRQDATPSPDVALKTAMNLELVQPDPASRLPAIAN